MRDHSEPKKIGNRKHEETQQQADAAKLMSAVAGSTASFTVYLASFTVAYGSLAVPHLSPE